MFLVALGECQNVILSVSHFSWLSFYEIESILPRVHHFWMLEFLSCSFVSGTLAGKSSCFRWSGLSCLLSAQVKCCFDFPVSFTTLPWKGNKSVRFSPWWSVSSVCLSPSVVLVPSSDPRSSLSPCSCSWVVSTIFFAWLLILTVGLSSLSCCWRHRTWS